ncbi:MAG: DoxX-like family protein [Flavihumibacter sp.]|nr:DoxX-like family protein [Flavihumibacter sp.]
MKRILEVLIALVWLVNGLYCKVLNGVPRHEAIVARVLQLQEARGLTLLIGLSEIGIAIWIISRFKSRLAAIVQMLLVASMNLLEFLLARDLLLWGSWNSVFALLFIALIYFTEFVIGKPVATNS